MIFLTSDESPGSQSESWSIPTKGSQYAFHLVLGCLGSSSYRQMNRFSSVTQSCPTLFNPGTAAHQASLSITNSQSLLKPMPIESVMPSNHLILCHPLLPPPSIFSSIRVFSNESVLSIRWPKYRSFSFSISPSYEYSVLIFFRMDLVGSPCSPRDSQKGSSTSQFKSISSSALRFLFMVQLSHPYMTTGKTIALTTQTFVGKVMSLLFNMLSRLVIIFLPRSKHLLISWLQSPSAVILEFKKIKSVSVSIVAPSICHEVMGRDAMILAFWMLSFKPTFSLSSFTFIKRLFSSSLLSAIRVVSSAYLRLLIFLLAILIPAYASSSPAFLMMYSAYKLSNQDDNIAWLFPIWKWSVVPRPVLTVASKPTGFQRNRLGGPIFPIFSEFSTVYCDPCSQRLWQNQ